MNNLIFAESNTSSGRNDEGINTNNSSTLSGRNIKERDLLLEKMVSKNGNIINLRSSTTSEPAEIRSELFTHVYVSVPLLLSDEDKDLPRCSNNGNELFPV